MSKTLYGKKQHYLWNLTYRCQNTCPMCWQVLMGRERQMVPFNVGEAAPSEWAPAINALPPSMLDISGGEPTLYQGFLELVKAISDTHTIALSTNLQGDAVQKILACRERFVSVNCSWHRGQGIPIDEFAERVKTLKKSGLNCFVNIVDHPTSMDEPSKYILESHGINVFVSPFENPLKLHPTNKKLICNAGLNTFTLDPGGDVYRCLTWFRYPGREQAYLGNLIKGTFQPFTQEHPCNLSCDIYYILDPLHNHKHMFSTYVRKAELEEPPK